MTDGFKVVTDALRAEAMLWQQKADQTEPVVQAVKETYLTWTAFSVIDVAVFPALANAQIQAHQYEEFRACMEQTLQGAATEFNQISDVLRRIADEYDRTESITEIDIGKFYEA
ncbi:ESX-1 secretion-associated protein [Saccharothrix sp. AJ9571]|nr:ESX-1 secretion-associated protein [Saccharothrix sp. AJ9571]